MPDKSTAKSNGNPDPKSAGQPSARRRVWSMIFRILLPLVITVGLCYKLFSDVDYHEMLDIIERDCNYWWIVLALVISIFSHIFRAMRWRIQLRAIDVRPPLFYVVLSIFGTYAVNLVFPRLGELWRTGYISQRQRAPFDAVFGSMVADRLADTVTVALITLLTFIFAGQPLLRFIAEKSDAGTVNGIIALLSSPWLYLGGVAAVVIAVCLLRRFRNVRPIAAFIGFCRGLWHGFAAIATMHGRVRWLLLTLCIWGCYFMQLYVAFFAFPATAQVVADHGVAAVMVCFVLSSIAMVIPSNGGIGPWQVAVIFGLGIYSAGIPELTETYATSFANLVMGSQTLLLIILGLFTFICIAVDRRRSRK